MKKICSIFSLLLSVTLCTPLFAQNSLRVVSSIPPLNALAAGILSGEAEPTILVPPEASHHHYVLKPSDMRSLSQADIVIWIGTSLEIFLEKPLAQLSNKTLTIEIQTLPGLTLYPVRHNQNWQQDENHHVHGGIDPHLWLDPDNAIIIVKALTRTFTQKDPSHADVYQKNSEEMIKKIQAVDAENKIEIAPIKDKPFLVFHDGYQYFEKHYGLHAVGSISINTDLPPSAQHLHALTQKIEKENISCVFTEPGISPALVNTLARDTDIHVGELDTMGKGHQFTDYLHLLTFNAHSLRKCLS